MIAVAPKGENDWRCRRRKLDRRGSRGTPAPLEDNRIDLLAPLFAHDFRDRCNSRQLCKGATHVVGFVSS